MATPKSNRLFVEGCALQVERLLSCIISPAHRTKFFALMAASILWLVLWGSPLCNPLVAAAHSWDSIPCEVSITLDEFVDCVLGAMPRSETEGFAIPDVALEADWNEVTAAMLGGACSTDDLPATLQAAGYALVFFPTNDASYCILYEAGDANADGVVDRGWGTFIVNLAPARLLDIQISHPLNDTNTGTQGIAVFEQTGARSFSMAGTHRRANAAISTCQPSFQAADAAHNTQMPFHWFSNTLLANDLAHDKSAVVLQFHGMAASTCPGVDVFITQGFATRAEVAAIHLLTLQANLATVHPDWQVVVPGDLRTCGLAGSTNVQGRLWNGVLATQVCDTPAIVTEVSGRFLHIEQKFDFRNPDDWVDAIAQTFPVLEPVGITSSISRATAISGHVFPNPFATDATLVVETAQAQFMEVKLFDVRGRLLDVLYSGQVAQDYVDRIKIERKNMPAGLYFLQISSSDGPTLIPLVAR